MAQTGIAPRQAGASGARETRAAGTREAVDAIRALTAVFTRGGRALVNVRCTAITSVARRTLASELPLRAVVFARGAVEAWTDRCIAPGVGLAEFTVETGQALTFEGPLKVAAFPITARAAGTLVVVNFAVQPGEPGCTRAFVAVNDSSAACSIVLGLLAIGLDARASGVQQALANSGFGVGSGAALSDRVALLAEFSALKADQVDALHASGAIRVALARSD